MRSLEKAGFTTVELLITLFVGALLLGGGYQLYAIVTRTGADSRNQIDASNIVYEQLRSYQETVSGACAANTTNISAKIPSSNTLPGDAAMTLVRSCPFGAGQDISKLTVALAYGEEGARNEVSHTLYTK